MSDTRPQDKFLDDFLNGPESVLLFGTNTLKHCVKYLRKSNYEHLLFIYPHGHGFNVSNRFYNNGTVAESIVFERPTALALCKSLIKCYVAPIPSTKLQDLSREYKDVAIIKEDSYLTVCYTHHSEFGKQFNKRKYTIKAGKLHIEHGLLREDEFQEAVSFFNDNYKGKQI